ncbi:ScbR family autoregulator-binding transcription factor [Streptomyces mashuensis]|nr:ScbR family autoregulator-binding transcription factor [Streptomyces mashuensis]
MKVDSDRQTRRDASPAAKGVPQLKQERAIRTRAVILKAAAAAFAERGFPNVTIVDIADRAGMTKGAVYFHFGSKEALALAVAEEFYRYLTHTMRPALEKDQDPVDKVADLLRRAAASFRDDPITQAGARLQIERQYIGVDMPLPYVGFTDLIASLLQQGLEQGLLPEGATPEALARVLVSAVFGAQHISWVLEDRSDVVERTQEVLDAVLYLPRQQRAAREPVGR